MNITLTCGSELLVAGWPGDIPPTVEQLLAATGDAWDMERIVTTGTRIYTMRHAFNLREGLNPLARNMPGRIVGEPPLKAGNVKDITVDYRTVADGYEP